MNPHDHNARVKPGPNSWLVQRTDRDAADAGEAITSLGSFMNHVLQYASSAGLRGVFQVLHTSHTGGRFVVGAARPILAQAHRDRPPVPEGLVLACSLGEAPPLRRVRALRPWYLSVTFDWHAGLAQLSWPHHFAQVLGSNDRSDLDLDWLLLETHEVRK